jgi:hypothetical protein
MTHPDTDGASTTSPNTAATPIDPPAHSDQGGWTIERLRVLNDAAGICARCGIAGADTATRGWVEEDRVAAHTRCVVGLGPPPARYSHAAA